jgi:hypothetical protein
MSLPNSPLRHAKTALREASALKGENARERKRLDRVLDMWKIPGSARESAQASVETSPRKPHRRDVSTRAFHDRTCTRLKNRLYHATACALRRRSRLPSSTTLPIIRRPLLRALASLRETVTPPSHAGHARVRRRPRRSDGIVSAAGRTRRGVAIPGSLCLVDFRRRIGAAMPGRAGGPRSRRRGGRAPSIRRACPLRPPPRAPVPLAIRTGHGSGLRRGPRGEGASDMSCPQMEFVKIRQITA